MSTIEPGVAGRRVGSGTRRKGSKSRELAEIPLTLTVPEAGKKYFGLSRNAAYEAAARGDIPTIRVGKLLRVPVRAMEALLDNTIREQPAEA